MDETEKLAPGSAEGQGQDGAAQAEKEPREYVTLVDEDEEEGEQDEGGEEGEGEEGSAKPNAGEDGAHKRRPGSAKWRDRAQRAERELAEMRRVRTPREEPDGDEDDLVEPKESDFKNWVEYQRALQQYDTRKTIREEDKRRSDRQAQGQAQREHAERLATYNHNLDQVRDRVPDFDRVMADSRDMPVSPAAESLILESPKGPLLAYYLAKNPDRLAELNRMTPTAAAREIGRLEARIRAPKPKSRTSATPPPKPQRGSGGAPAAKNPADMSMAEYIKWRESA